jgi:quinol monooxygenase YgiN
MSIMVAGTVRIPPEKMEAARPHMQAVMGANRLEDGCVVFSYAEELGDPGLIRVFEIWRDQAALTAHGQSAHVTRWRALWPELGVSDRQLVVYEIAGERAL